ncbi:helix-turn-helix domain-containing protein [Actinomyces israelii]|uniref:helix-turn-helix domain-containing protein n=1 Tax=Actinomyces israelii TaxID=1659 RepID=UPI0005BA339B|nr:helix-turn-helix transcriptional regulator [Actinomyces israelii]
MTAPTVPISVARALDQAGFSQRKAAELTGISQPTLSRILSGQRAPTLPELILLAQVTGVPLASLTGRGTVADRCLMAARAVDGAAMEEMRRTLIGYLELDAYLADQAIPRAC